MVDATMHQIELTITALRQEVGGLRSEVSGLRSEVSELRNEVRTAASLAASAQTQVTAHVAVCEERQRLTMIRQTERDRWHEEQATAFKQFMLESSADRARIHQSVIQTAGAAREELRTMVIKALGFVAGSNVISVIAVIAGLLKFGGGH